jgi:hypothetical protein
MIAGILGSATIAGSTNNQKRRVRDNKIIPNQKYHLGCEIFLIVFCLKNSFSWRVYSILSVGAITT